MFTLNGTPISSDVAFTHNDIQYPSNWIKLATPEERAAIGIEEVPDPVWYDERFYWGVDNPKDLDMLKTQWIAQTKAAANAELSQTDWMIIRKAERNIDIPADVATSRAATIQAANDKEAAITAATTVEELISVLFPVIVEEQPAISSEQISAL